MQIFFQSSWLGANSFPTQKQKEESRRIVSSPWTWFAGTHDWSGHASPPVNSLLGKVITGGLAPLRLEVLHRLICSIHTFLYGLCNLSGCISGSEEGVLKIRPNMTNTSRVYGKPSNSRQSFFKHISKYRVICNIFAITNLKNIWLPSSIVGFLPTKKVLNPITTWSIRGTPGRSLHSGPCLHLGRIPCSPHRCSPTK